MSCAIEAEDLRFRYPNGVVGLDGVDLSVRHGERVAVLGPNGAGKTTLMLHLNGLLTGEARRMRVALSSRGYRPRHALQVAALGRVATALFLRTFERGERVYVAMLARGYTGTTPRLRALAFGRADVLFLAALGAVLLPLRVVA